MKGSYLGEFQEIVLLAVMALGGKGYGVNIQQELKERIKRDISRGALHSALVRLDEKGFVTSYMGGATSERGGRQKRYYEITKSGKNALEEAQQLRNQFYRTMPQIAIDIN